MEYKPDKRETVKGTLALRIKIDKSGEVEETQEVLQLIRTFCNLWLAERYEGRERPLKVIFVWADEG